MNSQVTIWIATLLLPLVGGLSTFLFFKKKPGVAASVFVLLGFLNSLFLHGYSESIIIRFEWIPGIELGWNIDRVSKSLLSLVLFISSMVHLFSVEYMKLDPGNNRYFGFLGFFTFSMLGLLSADHLILLFVFWELVGFSSFLLIGYWYKDEGKAYSSRYAFIVNRVADAALISAICLVYFYADSSFLSEFSLTTVDPNLSFLIGAGFILGAFGKSAQFPFYTWLPRAMAGPTPVSALIHAATMVTAGVYLLVRVGPSLPDLLLNWIEVFGAFTAILAAFSALLQNDIKKVLAYSTVSQLGYMTYAIGVNAIEMSFFHLWTHAFF